MAKKGSADMRGWFSSLLPRNARTSDIELPSEGKRDPRLKSTAQRVREGYDILKEKGILFGRKKR